MISLINFLRSSIGLDHFSHIVVIHMIIRGVIIYFFGITIARFDKKLLGIRTPFNFMLFIMLGSIFADAIFDEMLFLPIMITVILLILLNSMVTILLYYLPSLELYMIGVPVVLIKDGEMQWSIMKKYYIRPLSNL